MALTQTAGGVCYDGLQKARHDIPHVERVLHYMRHSSQIPPRSIDPAQVKSVTVCGVEIPVE